MNREDEPDLVGTALDLFVYAPLGLALEARELLPKLAERVGRMTEAEVDLLVSPYGLEIESAHQRVALRRRAALVRVLLCHGLQVLVVLRQAHLRGRAARRRGAVLRRRAVCVTHVHLQRPAAGHAACIASL